MSVGGFDIELNGVKYNLAEDAEGQHYADSGEPLRPPNAVTLQGENRQKFQMRPDVIKWSLTDWSGGEGQIKYNPELPNRWRELTAVRVFDNPGQLEPGYATEVTQDASGDFNFGVQDGRLTVAVGGLHLVSETEFYTWNESTKTWSSATTIGSSGHSDSRSIDADSSRIYFYGPLNQQDVWALNPSTNSVTKLTDATVSSGLDKELIELGGSVYMLDWRNEEVWEVAKDASDGATLIDEWPEDPYSSFGQNLFTTLNNKLYVMLPHESRTSIREIVPSSAAGPAHGAEIARINGMTGISIWAHGGLLYFSGIEGDKAAVFYLDPSGPYGTLGRIRPDTVTSAPVAGVGNGKLLQHYAIVDMGSDLGLLEFDSVTGGYAFVGLLTGSAASIGSHSIAILDGDIFAVTANGSVAGHVYKAIRDSYEADNAEAISAWHDFDLADEKILGSLVLSTKALPADWTVYVDHATDNTDTWTNVIEYNTTSGTGTKVAVSTDTSTVKFRTLSLRIRMVYTGADDPPTSAPVVLGVDANAQVAKTVTVFRLLLDLSDDKDRQGGKSGNAKLQNIRTAKNLESVVAFKDGYESVTPGVFTEYDMVIDSYSIVLSTPGEGVAQVTLREPI